MSRRRDRRGLHVARGERYALIPREVLESAAYRAIPAWTTRVLLALAVQYYGRRNGSLALPMGEARTLGVTTSAQLYGGLQILELADLIARTRRGHLVGGRQLPTLYALTWRPIDDPAPGVIYDSGITVSPMPTHAWAQWTRPADWDDQVRMIAARARGQRDRPCPYAARAASQRGESAAHSVGSDGGRHRSQREESGLPDPAHSVCETSEISARGRHGRGLQSPSSAPPDRERAIARLITMHEHMLDGDIARACHAEVMQVAAVRARLATGWRPDGGTR